jgi:DNA-binding MarR family transcriptional regulator
MLDITEIATKHGADVLVGGSAILERLFTISKALRGLLGIRLAEIGLHPGQDEMLLAFGPRPLSVKTIAQALGVRPSTVSKMVDRLADRGYVVREPDYVDRRMRSISITPLGVEARSNVLALYARLEAEFVKAFDSEGAAGIRTALADTEDLLHRRLARLR